MRSVRSGSTLPPAVSASMRSTEQQVVYLCYLQLLRIQNPVLSDPWIRDGKSPDPGSGINIPDHISESLVTPFWVKIIKFFVVDQGIRDGKIGIQDPG